LSAAWSPHPHAAISVRTSLLDPGFEMTERIDLFTPFHGGGLALANRIVMAPMTRRKSPGGIPGGDVSA
jgi:2,4-dienoyl-CoA reductase-like NADH-dependent reductase (Old Yellow Enzyme family)